MVFKSYSSIERDIKSSGGSYSQFYQYLMERNLHNTMCCYQQKCHGANFGIYFDGVEFKVNKRTKFLEPTDDFFGVKWIGLVNDVKEKIALIYNKLNELCPNMTHASFNCELAGGGVAEGHARVQDNTSYCDSQFLYFFDIKIFVGEDSFFLNPLVSTELFGSVDLFHAKILGTGLLSDLIKINDTTNYISLTLRGVQEHQSEGIVIKSIDDDNLYCGDSRIIIKKINPMFEETVKSRVNNVSIENSNDVPKEVIEYTMLAKDGVTAMRLDKVCGNLGVSKETFNKKDFTRIINCVIDDILADLKKDGYNIEEKHYKYSNKVLSKLIVPLVKEKLF